VPGLHLVKERPQLGLHLALDRELMLERLDELGLA
jgi:hypothetical protein